MSAFDPEVYVRALRFAADKHRDQRVPGTELPYVVHVVSVAAEVIAALGEVERPELAIACALLHDTVEDTGTGLDEIAGAFGADVAAGVAALTKDAQLPKGERMADSLRRIREQPREVWCVKLADRITNLAPPPVGWTREKCRAYRDEAGEIVAALGDASPTLAARLRARIAAYVAFT
jgi:(p)ppGpp synthase/HD superfamily hydrolase